MSKTCTECLDHSRHLINNSYHYVLSNYEDFVWFSLHISNPTLQWESIDFFK